LVYRTGVHLLARRVEGEPTMHKLLAVSCLVFAACAGAGAMHLDRETSPHAAPRFKLVAVPDTSPAFPQARQPALPSADRIWRQIRNELGDVASADVRLCVARDGRVARVDMVRPTRFAEFNRAVIDDVADWQFSELPGSTSDAAQHCEVTTIHYRVP
jgi:outer membrane biosynthesis protein TonB